MSWRTRCRPPCRSLAETPPRTRRLAIGRGRTSGIPPSAAAAVLPAVEGYEVLGRLGEGAMGTVWRAVQLSTGRPVALKLLSAAAFGSARARARFDREVELTSRLEHPHIARLYDSGVRRGVWCYAMELIDGLPLDRY